MLINMLLLLDICEVQLWQMQHVCIYCTVEATQATRTVALLLADSDGVLQLNWREHCS
jgi:hypothetical protein